MNPVVILQIMSCLDPNNQRGSRVILIRTEAGSQASPDSCPKSVSSCSALCLSSPERVLPFQDMFAAAVSLVTGKILYISNQVASIFHCKRDAFQDAKFVEFLAPRDVSVFHSSTTPCKLPPWSLCSGAGEAPQWQPRGGVCPIHLGRGPHSSGCPLSKAGGQNLFRINLERKIVFSGILETERHLRGF